jgi:hypothetical protein
MENKYRLPSALETLNVDYLLFKFGFGPLMIYFGITGFHLSHPILSAVFCIPVLTAGIFFFMTITRVKPEADALAVRRFFRWHRLTYSEIKECDDNLFLPFIGSVRLKPYVLLFGKIYFWIPVSAHTNRIDKELIPYIRHRAGLAPD